jgi:antitoxin component YwqK of YwqJK toxin-antitoxin module
VKKTWYPNGKLRYEGVIENGEPVGDWLFWTEKGVKSEKSY